MLAHNQAFNLLLESIYRTTQGFGGLHELNLLKVQSS